MAVGPGAQRVELNCGTPLGSDAVVHRQLLLKRAEHDRLLGRIPAIENAQSLARSCGPGRPAATHLGAEHDERLSPSAREFRLHGVLATLGQPQYSAVNGRCTHRMT